MNRLLRLTLLVFPVLFFASNLFSQSYFDYVTEKTRNADVIVEAVVESAEAYRDKNGRIVTKNYLLITDHLKNQDTQSEFIIVETAGGSLDGITKTCSHCSSLGINEKGIFFLKSVNQKYILLDGNDGKINRLNIDEKR